jgi:hypothetical protein
VCQQAPKLRLVRCHFVHFGGRASAVGVASRMSPMSCGPPVLRSECVCGRTSEKLGGCLPPVTLSATRRTGLAQWLSACCTLLNLIQSLICCFTTFLLACIGKERYYYICTLLVLLYIKQKGRLLLDDRVPRMFRLCVLSSLAASHGCFDCVCCQVWQLPTVSIVCVVKRGSFARMFRLRVLSSVGMFRLCVLVKRGSYAATEP